MNLRRIFRGPLVWILLAVVAIGLLIELSGRMNGGYRQVPTSQVVAIINGNEPLSDATLVDGEQLIRITLKDEPRTKYEAVWVGNQSDPLIERLNQRVADKTLDRWVGENPRPSFLSNLLAT